MYKILLVDDDPSILKSIPDAMEDKLPQHEFLTAKNGNDALNQLKECVPNLVITDLRMPKLNGIQLIEVIKGIYPNLLVILASGNDESMIGKHLADAFFFKPSGMPELAKIIKYYLHSAGLQNAV